MAEKVRARPADFATSTERGEVRAAFKHMLEVQLHAVASTIATKLPKKS